MCGLKLMLVLWVLLGGCSLGREKVLLRGRFHSVAHKGAGEAIVVLRGDGSLNLILSGVKTYPADDLAVCLVAARDAEDNDTVLNSGKLCLGSYRPKETVQTLRAPVQVDLHRYRSVSIWSQSYQVNFTTAPLD